MPWPPLSISLATYPIILAADGHVIRRVFWPRNGSLPQKNYGTGQSKRLAITVRYYYPVSIDNGQGMEPRLQACIHIETTAGNNQLKYIDRQRLENHTIYDTLVFADPVRCLYRLAEIIILAGRVWRVGILEYQSAL